jgi:hypothetical protein
VTTGGINRERNWRTIVTQNRTHIIGETASFGQKEGQKRHKGKRIGLSLLAHFAPTMFVKSLNTYTKTATFSGIALALLVNEVSGDCLANEEFNDFFEINSETGRRQSIPRFESCCMQDVCGLQCPEPTPEPGPGKFRFGRSLDDSNDLRLKRYVVPLLSSLFPGYGIAVVVTFALSFIIGIGSLFQIKGSAENFFVAGRSLPLLVVSMTLAAQSLDSNSLLGNVDNSYKYSFWDGKKQLFVTTKAGPSKTCYLTCCVLKWLDASFEQ